jgi:acyl-coenzyme A synthetase/AMP-(fatty) acid ligase
MAINMIGGIVLPLDVNLMPSAYPEMIKKVKAKALFISDEYKGVIKKIKTYSVSIDKSLKKRRNLKYRKLILTTLPHTCSHPEPQGNRKS